MVEHVLTTRLTASPGDEGNDDNVTETNAFKTTVTNRRKALYRGKSSIQPAQFAHVD